MIFVAAVLVLGIFAYTLLVRAKDLPAPEAVSPVEHLEERKKVIYENLRDLQFEYRLGKLSDQDYQQTKQDLQAELAKVLAEIDAVHGAAPPAPKPAKAAIAPGTVCPHCNAKFASAMKFCGECGKPIPQEATR